MVAQEGALIVSSLVDCHHHQQQHHECIYMHIQVSALDVLVSIS